MSEDKPTEGGKELPGGFASVEAMYAQLQTYKEDIAKHKTRASDLDAVTTERDSLAEKLAAIEAANKTELEKALDRVAELEAANAEALREAEAVRRNSLLTVEISKRLGGRSERLAQIYTDLARAKCSGYKNEDDLTELLNAVDEELKDVAISPQEDGQRVTITGHTPPQGRGAGSKEAQEFANLSKIDQIRLAREKAK